MHRSISIADGNEDFMKKTTAILLSIILVISLCACAKRENRADTSLKEGEIMLSGFVAESYGSSLLLQKQKATTGKTM